MTMVGKEFFREKRLIVIQLNKANGDLIMIELQNPRDAGQRILCSVMGEEPNRNAARINAPLTFTINIRCQEACRAEENEQSDPEPGAPTAWEHRELA